MLTEFDYSTHDVIHRSLCKQFVISAVGKNSCSKNVNKQQYEVQTHTNMKTYIDTDMLRHGGRCGRKKSISIISMNKHCCWLLLNLTSRCRIISKPIQKKKTIASIIQVEQSFISVVFLFFSFISGKCSSIFPFTLNETNNLNEIKNESQNRCSRQSNGKFR